MTAERITIVARRIAHYLQDLRWRSPPRGAQVIALGWSHKARVESQVLKNISTSGQRMALLPVRILWA